MIGALWRLSEFPLKKPRNIASKGDTHGWWNLLIASQVVKQAWTCSADRESLVSKRPSRALSRLHLRKLLVERVAFEPAVRFVQTVHLG
jgi:hypothetical protein